MNKLIKKYTAANTLSALSAFDALDDDGNILSYDSWEQKQNKMNTKLYSVSLENENSEKYWEILLNDAINRCDVLEIGQPEDNESPETDSLMFLTIQDVQQILTSCSQLNSLEEFLMISEEHFDKYAFSDNVIHFYTLIKNYQTHYPQAWSFLNSAIEKAFDKVLKNDSDFEFIFENCYRSSSLEDGKKYKPNVPFILSGPRFYADEKIVLWFHDMVAIVSLSEVEKEKFESEGFVFDELKYLNRIMNKLDEI